MREGPMLLVAVAFAMAVAAPSAGGTPPPSAGGAEASAGGPGAASSPDRAAPEGGSSDRRAASPAFPAMPLLPAQILRATNPSGGEGGGPVGGADLRASTWNPSQGEPVVVAFAWDPATDNASLGWKGRSYPMIPQGEGRFVALVGIDLLDAPGRAILAVEASRGGVPHRFEAEVDVAKRDFPVQRLTLPARMAVFDAPTLERIEREARALDERFERIPGPPLWRFPFVPPVESFRPTGFGARRIINGEPRAPHAGADVSLPEGTPVVAIADGVVAFAGEQFFAGNSVVLDHGGGMFSIYYHLKEFLVADQPADGVGGQRVSAGERIGSVGATGRAAGPHLHFGVRVPGGRIDPGLLLPGPR